MDLFEIVSSFIPDEQKADIKAKIDGEIESIAKSNETKLKKELSKKYGVNLFEEDVEKAFSETQFVKKDKVENIAKELETFKTQIEEKEKTLKSLQEEVLIKDITVKLVKEGFKEERIELIKPILLKGDENEKIEDKVKRVKQEVPELFNQSALKKTYNEDYVDPTDKSELEKYFEQRANEINNMINKKK